MTGETARQRSYQSRTIDEFDTGSCREYPTESEAAPLSEKVDICVTVVGGETPPSLPIREELRSNGVECIYNAKGVGQEVVSKERALREAEITKRLKVIEKKLQKSSSPRKRKKGLKKLQDLQKNLERKMQNSASGISYSSYALHMVELMKTRCMLNNEKSEETDDELKVGSEATGSDVCSESAKSQIETTDSFSMGSQGAGNSAEGSFDDGGENIEDTNTSAISLPEFESTTEMCNLLINNDHEKEPLLKREFQQETDEMIPQERRSLVRRRKRSARRRPNDVISGASSSFSPSIGTKTTITGDTEKKNPVRRTRSKRATSPLSPVTQDVSPLPKDTTSTVSHISPAIGTTAITGDTMDYFCERNQEYGDIDSVMSNEYIFDCEKSEVGGVLESVAEDSVLESLAEDSVLSTTSASSVHFKGIKASTVDKLKIARALLASAKTRRKSIDTDSVETIKKAFPVTSNDASSIDTDVTPVSRERMTPPPSSSSPPTFIQEKGRYHLFVTHACPWSHRTSVVRALKGLDDVIGMSYVNCTWDPLSVWDAGFESEVESDASFWSISDSICNKATEDSDDLVFQTFRETVLENLNGPIQVPVLWDKHKMCIISNSSVEIMWILNFEFNKWAKRPKLNLFPRESKLNNDVNQWLHKAINVGVYRCGVATSQENYDEAVDELTVALDKADAIVKKGGFLTGKRLTESDIRLFVTLIRFDEVYRVHFKTNTRRISKMSGLLTYVRDIYQVKQVKQTCDMGAIKKAYYGARAEVGIVPRGEGFLELLEKRKE